LKVIQELGEPFLNTPINVDPPSTEESTETHSNESEKSSSVLGSHESVAEDPPSPHSEQQKGVNVTTTERKPVKIPDTVHVHITADNLKEYVGPPVYQKDRMYTKPPPPGVSTGLGYSGNGSGAVMPIEAMVCSQPRVLSMLIIPA